MSESNVQNVRVVVRCPACGAEDNEVEFDETELGSMITLPCEECPERITVDVTVGVQTDRSKR